MTNYLCSSDKLPLFFISSNNRFFSEGYKRYAFVNDSLSMTDKEMRKSFRECEHAVVIEGGHIICVGKEGRVIGRKEFREEHSDFFEVRDAFSSDLIKDGKVYVSDNLKIGEAVFLKIHNDTDGVISYRGELFIEPHGMMSFPWGCFYGQDLFDVKKEAGDDWGTKVWIECPNGKSPKMYTFFSKEEVVNKRRKRKVLEQMEYGANTDEKEILKALREKDPKDWIKTILEFGKKSNAIDKSEIKIEDKKEDPKVEEKNYSVMKKAPKKIKKSEY